MAKGIEDLLAEMRQNPANVRFRDACKVVTHYFDEPRQNGTSHKVWRMPWPGDPRVNMQEGDGGKAKRYQVEQALRAIDRLLAADVTPKETATPPAPPSKHKPSKKQKR